MGQPLTIQAIDINPYEIGFIRPYSFASTTVSLRTGFYISMTTSEGLKAVGEAAPLPGISLETIQKTKHDLTVAQTALIGQSAPEDVLGLLHWFNHHSVISSLCPSARFAIESAFMLLAAYACKCSLAELLGEQTRTVASAVLLQGTPAQIIDEARQGYQQGNRTFKLKVGDRNIPLDVKKVQDLKTIIGKDAMIRLDANRVWSFEEAVLFGKLVGHEQIEFIEEPLSDPARLSEFYQQTHIPIALDETLVVSRPAVTTPGRCTPALSQREGVAAYIIKPTVLGSMSLCLDWIDEARRCGKKAIISSSFESPVGLQILNELACLSGETAGLGTERWFVPVSLRGTK